MHLGEGRDRMLQTECLCLPQIYMLKLYSNVMMLEGEAFERELVLDEVRVLVNGISALKRVTREYASPPCSPPCEETIHQPSAAWKRPFIRT